MRRSPPDDDPAGRDGVVPQHAVVLTASTADFHSRTYRIARGLAERGHRVTVVARWQPGLDLQERHPAGYEIVRLASSPREGLPFVGRMLARRSRAAAGATPSSTAARGASPQMAPETHPGRRNPLRRIGRAVLGPVGTPFAIRALRQAAQRHGLRGDIYHAMTYTRVSVALELRRRRGGRVLYDAAEIYLESGNLAGLRGPMRWWIERTERSWAHAADRVVTGCEPYARAIRSLLGVPAPLVVMNCAYRYDPPSPGPRRFHEVLGLPAGIRTVLYHGALFPDRGIEQLRTAIRSVPGAVLVLMGYGPLREQLAREEGGPESDGRVLLLPPVVPEELLGWVASADVAAMPIQPTTLNHRLSTPNKLFEAMAAGVAVVASDLEGMAPIVRAAGCGLLVDPTDVDEITQALRGLLADEPRRAEFGRRGLEAAHRQYNWEQQFSVLLEEYTRLTGRRW